MPLPSNFLEPSFDGVVGGGDLDDVDTVMVVGFVDDERNAIAEDCVNWIDDAGGIDDDDCKGDGDCGCDKDSDDRARGEGDRDVSSVADGDSDGECDSAGDTDNDDDESDGGDGN